MMFFTVFIYYLTYRSDEGKGNGLLGNIPVNGDCAEEIAGLFGLITDGNFLCLTRLYFLPVVSGGGAVARGGDAFEPECLRSGVAQADGLLFRAVGRHCAQIVFQGLDL